MNEPVPQLKPCPFCGKTPIMKWSLDKPIIECANRKCDIQPSTFLHVSTDNARKLASIWNKRKEDE
ncbi:Lar family restriction alleviation protein [Salibacterium lacus]|uniref:Lar family restriction alleviation protein n=1 Tax=Salibacterium lacus TaxID=1898109 RepID=A0ABW5T0I2_9BACI